MGTGALSLQRHRRQHPNRAQSNGDGASVISPSHGEGVNSRPWTTGEFEDRKNDDETSPVSTSTDGFLRDGGVLLRHTRSAHGRLLSSSPGSPDPPFIKAECSAEEAASSSAGDSECEGDGNEGVPGVKDGSLPKLSADDMGAGDQDRIDGVIDGDARDGDDDAIDGEESEFPGELPKNIARRVSFADEQVVNNASDGSGDSREERSGRIQPTKGWGAQRRRMSSLIGSSNGYLEGNGSINGHFSDKSGRRKSDLERCQKAMEIARAAHELLFNDTRPDGLRPITGNPMNDGRDALGSGGLFVGLAGLKGFDLSFLGVASIDQSGGGQGSTSVSSRLAASRRLSSRAAADANDYDEKPLVTGGSPSSPLISRAASPTRSNASRMAAGFLLDRKPGSLMANPPRSPGCEASPGAAPASPAKANIEHTVAQVEEGRQMVTDSGSPKMAHHGSEDLKSASGTDLPQCNKAAIAGEMPPTEKSNASLPGVELRRSEALDMDDVEHEPDIPEGFGKDGWGNGAPHGLRGGTNRGETQNAEETCGRGSRAGGLAGTAAISSAATAVGSIFAPKAAVLWSARDLGVDELVSSIATSGKEVKECLRTESCWDLFCVVSDDTPFGDGVYSSPCSVTCKLLARGILAVSCAIIDHTKHFAANTMRGIHASLLARKGIITLGVRVARHYLGSKEIMRRASVTTQVQSATFTR